jgi:hypothetical protein
MGGLIDDLIQAVVLALTAAIQSALNWALGLLSATMFVSPDVTGLPQVAYASTQAQLVANAPCCSWWRGPPRSR